MKKIPGIFLLIFLAATLTSASVHKYYVSVFQIEYSARKKELQITGRIFIDDLEKTLDTKYGKKFYLGTPKEAPETTAIIKQYLADKMGLKINGKAATFTFLAKEVEDDQLVCYLTVPAPKKIETIDVHNTLLFEMFRTQQNMINAKVGTERKSLLLTYDTPSGTITF